MTKDENFLLVKGSGNDPGEGKISAIQLMKAKHLNDPADKDKICTIQLMKARHKNDLADEGKIS